MGGGAVLGKRQMFSASCSSTRDTFLCEFDDGVDETNDSGLQQQSPSDDEIDSSDSVELIEGTSYMQYGVMGESTIQ